MLCAVLLADDVVQISTLHNTELAVGEKSGDGFSTEVFSACSACAISSTRKVNISKSDVTNVEENHSSRMMKDNIFCSEGIFDQGSCSIFVRAIILNDVKTG